MIYLFYKPETDKKKLLNSKKTEKKRRELEKTPDRCKI